MSQREIRVLSVVGLLFGVGTLYIGATGSCACGEQTVGQPLPFNWFMAEVDAGVMIIALSIVALAFSFLKEPPIRSRETGHPMTAAEPIGSVQCSGDMKGCPTSGDASQPSSFGKHSLNRLTKSAGLDLYFNKPY